MKTIVGRSELCPDLRDIGRSGEEVQSQGCAIADSEVAQGRPARRKGYGRTPRQAILLSGQSSRMPSARRRAATRRSEGRHLPFTRGTGRSHSPRRGELPLVLHKDRLRRAQPACRQQLGQRNERGLYVVRPLEAGPEGQRTKEPPGGIPIVVAASTKARELDGGRFDKRQGSPRPLPVTDVLGI